MLGAKVVICLVSGGIDSTVATTMKALDQSNVVYLLSIAYGQGAEEAERSQSDKVADWFLDRFSNVVEHFRLSITGSSRRSKAKYHGPSGDVALPRISSKGFVGWRQPNSGWPSAGYPSTRDEVFSLLGAAGAEARLRDLSFTSGAEIVLATNRDDLDNFSDIDPENYYLHLNAILARKLMPQAGKPVTVTLPLIALRKDEVILRGVELGAPLELTWSCYFGAAGQPCGTCDQCNWRRIAFRSAGCPDPALKHPSERGLV